MKNIFLRENLILCKKNTVVFFFILLSFYVNAQVTWTNTGCGGTSPTINKVFIDACANPEGSNEFAYMTTGSNPFDWSNLEITGSGTGFTAGANTGASTNPSLNNRPISSAFTSNPSVVAQLNAGVGATCNPAVFYVAPNPIPPGSAVIIRMSSDPVTLPTGTNPLNTLCGKGPVYVLTGTYVGTPGFFRNSNNGCNTSPTMPNTDPCTRIATFDMGNGCVQTVTYNIQNFPNPGSNNVGAYLTSSNTTGTSNDCYESPPCSNPPDPAISPLKIEYCDGTPMPSTTINCSNCAPLNTYYIYDAPTGGSLIYSGPIGTWPNANFVPPLGYNTYYVGQKFSFCNSGRTPIQINRKPIPVIVPIPNKVFCESNSCITLNLQGTAGASYTLSPTTGVTNPNSTSPIVCNTGNTVYTLTSTLDGCSTTTFVNFSTNTSLQNTGVAQPNMINCLNANTVLNATPQGSNFTYNWSQGATNGTPTVFTGGNYTVTITDSNNGCTKTATVNVVEDKTKPVITPFAPIKLTCANGFPNVPVTTMGSNLTYNWSPAVTGSASNPIISVAGTYTLTVTNSVNGCTDVKSVVVTEDKDMPNAVVAPAGKIDCITSSITFNTSGTSMGSNFTYSWTGSNGYSSNSLTPPPITQGGTYTFVVTNTTNGCTKSVTVVVPENKTLPNVTAGPNQVLNCYNSGSLLLGINGAATYSYQWSNGTTNGTLGVNSPGTYTLTVTDSANGCTLVSSAVITEDKTAPTVTPIAPVTVTCANPSPSLIVNASGGTNLGYNWSPSGSGANSPVTAGGNYTVTVVNQDNGCKTSVSVTVAEDKVYPDAVIAPPAILNCYNNSSVVLNTTGTSTGSPYTYQWSGGSQSGTTLPIPNATQPGTYTLTVTNPTNGCTKTTSVNVTQNIVPPNALAGPPKLLNCSNNGQVTIGTTNSGNYTYSWSNGSTSGTQTVTTPGNYTLTATDPINGCTISSTVTVTEDKSVPSITSIAPITITCANPSLTLNPVVAGNNLTYSWSPNGTGATPSITTPGKYTLTLTDAVSGCTDTKDVTVSEDKVAPTATILPALTLNCYNSSSVALDPTGTSTGTNFSYVWSGVGGFSSTSLTPQNVTQPGTYILTVTNSTNGCTKTASVTVAQDIVAPTANVGPPKTLNCYNNNSVTIGGSAVVNYTYLWSNANTSSSQTVTQTGNYDLTVTNTVNGCTSTAQVVVNQDNAPPTANAGADITINCYNPIKQLSATASNGTPLSYAWSGSGLVGGVNTLTPSVSQGGAYTLTVTNTTNGCTVTALTNVIAEKTAPQVAASVAGNLDCNVTTTNLDGNGSSVGANYTFQWTGPSFSNNTSLTPNVTTGGNYTLVITNTDNGCTSTKTIFVNQDITPPVSTIVPPTLLSCSFPTVNLQPNAASNASYFYTWTTSNGNFVSGTSSFNAQVDKQGTYTLVVINTANGCSSTASTNVIEDRVYPAAVVAPSSDLTCPVPLIQLNGSGSTLGSDISYTWTTGTGYIVIGENTLSPTVNKGGTYTLLVKNNTNGCSQTASVTVNDNRIYPTININTPQVVTCKNPNVQIDATSSSNGAGYTYLWKPVTNGVIVSGGTTLSLTVNTNGVYELVITNTANSCSSSQTIIVNQDKTTPTANAGPNKLLTCTNKSVQLTGTATTGNFITYAWGSAAGAVQTGGTTLTPTVSQATVYTLTVTNSQNGCSALSNVTVTVDTNVPIADAGAKKVIDCNISQVGLDGTKSNNGGQYTYTWTTTNGSFVSGQNTLQPTVNKPGIYSLKIKNNTNNCEADASVEVEDNRIKPIIAVAKPKDVNCAQPQIQLDGKGSSSGTEFSYTWTTSNGKIVSGGNTNNPTISKSGDYVLKIKNTDNGCERDTTIAVKEFFNTPKATIQNPDIITCVKPTFALDASTSTNVQNAIIQWKLRNSANIISGANTLQPIIDNSGFYKLILKDTISQCIDSLEIEVQKDANIPNADAGVTKELNCTTQEITIQATASSAATITYAWSTAGGNVVSGGNTLTPKIDKPGVYTLTVSNSANQCVKTSSVTITQDTIKPKVAALPPSILNCKVTVIKVDASASATGSKFKPQWTDPQSGIISGNTSLTPLINKPGTYTLNITNSGNTCVSSLPVQVIQNIVKPIADAKVKDTVTCRLPQVDLEGTVTASSGLYTFEWKTTNGNFLKDKNTLKPIVDKGGVYQLFVTDTVNFCVSNTQIEVIENTKIPQTDAGVGGNLTCAALELNLTGTVQNGDAKDLNYTWTTPNGNIINGDKTLIIKVDAPGRYILKIENRTNGCFTIDSTEVTQDANVPIVSIKGGGKLDCATTTYTLDGTASTQGVGITFEWKTENGANILSGANSLTPVINGGGIYTLTIKNANNNCIKSIQKTIEIDTLHAEIDIEKAILTCKEQEIWIKSTITQTNNYSVDWSSQNSILTPKSETQIKVNTKGFYTLKVKNIDNQCVTNRVVEILEDKIAPIADAGLTDQPICNDTAYVINATKSSKGVNFIYQWSSQNGQILANSTTLTPKVKPQATYKLFITNTLNGCTAEDTTRILNIKPKLNAAIVQHPLCFGGLGTIKFNGVSSGTPPFTYSIDGGKKYATKIEFEKLLPNTYDLKVQDANGCEDSLQVSVIEPPKLTLSLSSIHKIIIGDDVQFNATYEPDTMKLAEIKWTPSDSLSCGNCLNPIILRPFRGGTFDLFIRNDKGCEARASTQLNINRIIPVYAPTAFSPNGDKINDTFTLFANVKNVLKINYLRIYDRWGTLLFEGFDLNPNVESVGWDGTFRGEPLNSAVFVWNAQILRVDGEKENLKGDVFLEK